MITRQTYEDGFVRLLSYGLCILVSCAFSPVLRCPFSCVVCLSSLSASICILCLYFSLFSFYLCVSKGCSSISEFSLFSLVFCPFFKHFFVPSFSPLSFLYIIILYFSSLYFSFFSLFTLLLLTQFCISFSSSSSLIHPPVSSFSTPSPSLAVPSSPPLNALLGSSRGNRSGFF